MAKSTRRPEPKVVRPDDIDPKHRWDRPLQAPGHTQVDFEERVDFRRLHEYRLARMRAALAHSGLGALLSFDQHNIRYTTSTVIGEWARDKLTRYSLLTGNGDPYIWDFGSRGAAPRAVCAVARARTTAVRACWACAARLGGDLTLFKEAAKEIKAILHAEGVGEHAPRRGRRRAADALRAAEGRYRGARRAADDAAGARNQEHRRADAAQHGCGHGRRRLPGHRRGAQARGTRESQIVALATKRLYEMGSDCVEAINSISGERCSPHPHNFTDRLIRPGDQAFFDIIQSFMGYRTCYYRTFNVGRATPPQRTAYKKAREWMDRAIELLKPGMSTDKVAAKLPKAQEIGFASEMDAFGLNFCHGLGLGLHERPLISRLNSFGEPIELKAGMVFAVETYCPATDGVSAARIEEEVILTPSGAKIISLYPAEDLPIANPY